VFGIDMKIVDAAGEELPWDGNAAGDLQVRGHWVASEYFGGDYASPLQDGWFPTGDVAKIDADGFMQIVDRSKDVIKSGGEWISSADIENVASLHPEVATAVCIAARHPKWDERPLLLIVKKPGSALEADDLLTFFDGRVAKWWKPDAVLFIDCVPIGATGKVLKNQLRDQYGGHYLQAS
jgi:fatty-acyl-CoA synthase